MVFLWGANYRTREVVDGRSFSVAGEGCPVRELNPGRIA